MGFWDALFDYFINPILSFVWENIKAFKDCPSEFETMKENEKVIEKFLNDINRQNHDLERVEGFTKKMEDFKNEIKVIKEDHSRMRIISRLGIGKKLKKFNEKFKKEENSMNGFLGLAIQNRGEVNVPINDVTEFESMKKNAVTIQKFIKDIKKVNHGMETLDEFTNEMRELMYEAEDIMADYSHMETSILKENDRLAMAKKLKDFNDKIGIMQSRMDNFLSIASQNKKDIVPRRPCDPINDVDKIVGVGDAVSKIKEWIMNEDKKIRKMHYNGIGLVGRGGSGKTTLAQMILKDQEIKNYFGLKIMFVTVSQPVDVKMMMKSMVKQLVNKTKDEDDEGEMSEKIYKYLKGSRYLVILDDVWSLDGGWWKTIKNALPEGSENRIVITSRKRKIVEEMGVCAERIHVPSELKDEDGWSLFCISAETDVSENTEMKQIGMEIVRKCGGLPLAIKVMGGVVSSCEISPPKWMEIRDSFKQYISNNKNDIVMGSLGLSYEELRLTYLQPCLLCFGVFPEDYVIYRDKMITWWIGEGFVPLTEDGKISVELAERCFDELVNRSLVEVVRRDWNGKVLTCRLHDLVRDMLIQKGKNEAFFEIGKDKISRRIVVLNGDDMSCNQIIASKAKVRVIINNSEDMTNFSKIFNDCKYLRVLELEKRFPQHDYESMFESIGNLKNLTSLNITYVTFSMSGEYVKKLMIEKSQLLVLCLNIPYVYMIPDSITELKQLIWLDVSRCYRLSYLPKGLGNVSTLQVLKGFVPSQKKGCRFEELRKLTQLVTLEMKIGKDYDLLDGELNALSELHGLRHLTIDCRGDVNNLFVQKLVLPKKLDELRLVGYRGEETPPWLNAEHLPRLRCLSLCDGMRLKCFHENFYRSDQKMWGIVHLKLYFLPELEGDWNVILERLPYLKTLHSPDHSEIRLENYPTVQEFDEEFTLRSTCVV